MMVDRQISLSKQLREEKSIGVFVAPNVQQANCFCYPKSMRQVDNCFVYNQTIKQKKEYTSTELDLSRPSVQTLSNPLSLNYPSVKSKVSKRWKVRYNGRVRLVNNRIRIGLSLIDSIYRRIRLTGFYLTNRIQIK